MVEPVQSPGFDVVILHSNSALDQWLAAAGAPSILFPPWVTASRPSAAHPRCLWGGVAGPGERVRQPHPVAAGDDFTTYPRHPDGDAQQAGAAGADAVCSPRWSTSTTTPTRTAPAAAAGTGSSLP